MTTDGSWQTTIGTIASTAAIYGIGFSGVTNVITTYQAYASADASLEKSEKMLQKARFLLRELSPQQRKEIEIAAARSGSSEFTSLEHLERQLVDLLNMHCRLSKRCGETTFTQRHYPGSDFRRRLSRLKEHAQALLNDTLNTTVPCLNDIEYDPDNSRRAMEMPSSSESTFIPEDSRQVIMMERLPSSETRESFHTARESFSDPGGIPTSMV